MRIDRAMVYRRATGPERHRPLIAASALKRKKCATCGRPIPRHKVIPYCRGWAYVDDRSPCEGNGESYVTSRPPWPGEAVIFMTIRRVGGRLVSPCGDLYDDSTYRWWGGTQRIVVRRSEGRCEKCGTSGPDDGSTWYEFDHVIEIARGGDPLDPANVQLLCRNCHREKTSRFLSLGKIARHARPVHTRPLEAYT